MPVGDPTRSIEEQIDDYLIKHNTTGVMQSTLCKHFRMIANSNTILIYLNQLRDERKVDKYIDKNKVGPPTTWWRATTRMLEDD